MAIDINVHINLSPRQKRVMRGAVVAGVVIGALGIGIAVAGPKHTFVPTTVVSANDMNENFNDLDSRAVKLESGSGTAVGSVVGSLLSEAQFQAELNVTGCTPSTSVPCWVLADGRSVAGSKFATVTTQTMLPNLCGVFLRGKNNGRADGLQNPGGEIALGTYQADGFGSHNHGGSTGDDVYNPGGSGIWYDATGGGAYPFADGSRGSHDNSLHHHHPIASDGINETRPRNVAINYFIRVN